MKITLDQAEKLVKNTNSAEWKGWDLVLIDTRKDGYSRTDGIFRNGKWSVQRQVSPDREGLYNVTNNYLKFISTIRH